MRGSHLLSIRLDPPCSCSSALSASNTAFAIVSLGFLQVKQGRKDSNDRKKQEKAERDRLGLTWGEHYALTVSTDRLAYVVQT